jgi:hypothetical protein
VQTIATNARESSVTKLSFIKGRDSQFFGAKRANFVEVAREAA